MIPILDFQRRSLEGPVMKSTRFDLAFAHAVRELAEKYCIRFEGEALFADDTTADAVFQAAIDLLAGVGLYHIDTQRVIEFDREELLTLAREYRANPREAVFGKGRDRITVRAGKDAPPLLAAGAAGAIEPEWFFAYLRSLIELPSNRALGIAGGITSVDGLEPRAGTLSEMACARWECEQLLRMIQHAGRPGLHLGLLCTASTPAATMACMQPGLRDPHNTQIGIHVIPEQKIDWTRLLLAHFCEERGITPWTSCMSMLGGLCRNGGETAIGLIANLLAQLAYGHGSLASLFTNRLDGTWGDPEALWAQSAAYRAAGRNLRLPVAGVCAGNEAIGGSEACLYQTAAITLANTASGMNYAWIAGGDGTDAALMGQVMQGAATLDLESADDLVRRVFSRVEQRIQSGDCERSEFPQKYDLEKVEPLAHYADRCKRVRDGLIDLGVPLGA